MASYEGPADRLELYEAAVARVEGLERKGAKMPYTSRNGHMTSFLDKEGSVAIRLSPREREAFFSNYDSGVAVQYGREMKEFAVVPDSLLADTVEFAEWLKRGNDWVGHTEAEVGGSHYAW